MTNSGTTRNPQRIGRKGMVVSGNPLVSSIGAGILRDGGNAVDAAIAMAFAMCVVEPQSCQLGGDVFMQYWDAKGRHLHALNGAGAAPSGATAEAIRAPEGTPNYWGASTSQVDGDRIPLRGLRAATVPGAVDGWLTALTRWGSMPGDRVLGPAIALAEDGFAFSDAQVEAWKAYSPIINGHPHMLAAFRVEPVRTGAVLRQPNLAITLHQMAEGGRKAFYSGPFARKLLEYSERKGGFFTADDLDRHRARVLDPLLTTYRGYTVTEQPLASQGLLLLEMLNIVEGRDYTHLSPESSENVHLMAEVTKLAFADRDAFLGDLAAAPVSQLISKTYAGRQRRRINSKAPTLRFTPGRMTAGDGEGPDSATGRSSPSIEREGKELSEPADIPGRSRHGQDTTCICAVDVYGNAVVMIQSLCHAFGSGIVVPETGVVLGNRLTAFDLNPQSPNYLEPGKQPLSTLNTYMVFKGDELWALGGTPGGDLQVQTNLQVITQMIDHGRSPQAAIESPKWHVADDGPGLIVEERLPLDTCYELRTMGYRLDIDGPWAAPCASQCILIDEESGCLIGATDPRVDGLALGC